MNSGVLKTSYRNLVPLINARLLNPIYWGETICNKYLVVTVRSRQRGNYAIYRAKRLNTTLVHMNIKGNVKRDSVELYERITGKRYYFLLVNIENIFWINDSGSIKSIMHTIIL